MRKPADSNSENRATAPAGHPLRRSRWRGKNAPSTLLYGAGEFRARALPLPCTTFVAGMTVEHDLLVICRAQADGARPLLDIRPGQQSATGNGGGRTARQRWRRSGQVRLSKWSGRQDSNLRPSAPKADALPDCATPRPGGLRRFTLQSARTWWARQDSNPQPSRYERPALTIELQAPASGARDSGGRAGVARPAI